MVDPGVEQQILALYRELLTRDRRAPSSVEIAKCIGTVTRLTVWRALKRNGLEVGPAGRHPRLTDEEIVEAHARIISEDLTVAEVAASYDVPRTTLASSIVRMFGSMPRRESVVIEVRQEHQPANRKCLRCGKTGLTTWRCAACERYLAKAGSWIGG